MSIESASDYALLFEHIKATVKPERDANRDAKARTYWWKFLRPSPEMREAIAHLSYYFTVPRVSKWAVFIPAPLNWLPGDLNIRPLAKVPFALLREKVKGQRVKESFFPFPLSLSPFPYFCKKSIVVASDDFYILGVLTSQVHRLWVKAQSSTLEDRTRYTHNTCFETFPFPQTPSSKLVEQIRATAQQLHQYRTQQMEAKQWGITQLYNKFFDEPTSQLFKLHAQLDQL